MLFSVSNNKKWVIFSEKPDLSHRFLPAILLIGLVYDWKLNAVVPISQPQLQKAFPQNFRYLKCRVKLQVTSSRKINKKFQLKVLKVQIQHLRISYGLYHSHGTVVNGNLFIVRGHCYFARSFYLAIIDHSMKQMVVTMASSSLAYNFK